MLFNGRGWFKTAWKDEACGIPQAADNPLAWSDETMSDAIIWTPEAEARLKEIPFFVRPAARKKIEKLAAELGATQITVEVYEQAKQKFG